MFHFIRKSCNRISTRVNELHNYSIHMDISKRPSVGLIIIGDEILKGEVVDCNSHFLCQRLYTCGVSVKKISIISDEIDEIAKEVALFSAAYDHVITAGGIGPTHDDVTVQGIAKAFGEKLYPHPDLIELCKQFFNQTTLTEHNLKQSLIPESSVLRYTSEDEGAQQPRSKYPLISVRNVLIFPGVPQMLQDTFYVFEDMFRSKDKEWHSRSLYINRQEVDNAELISELNERSECTIGSYPIYDNRYYKNKITLESNSLRNIQDTIREFKSTFHSDLLIDYESDPILHAVRHVYEHFDSPNSDDLELNSYFKDVCESIKSVEDAFDRYGLDEICVAFNGGKDCTALLHLVYAVARKKFVHHQIRLKVLYIRNGAEFPEVELFINETKQRYEIDVLSIKGQIKQALGELQVKYPEIKAVFMGSRIGDPYSDKLKTFHMTDSDWPEFMRVNPLLHWPYANVWRFLRSLYLPYCSLYDQGYTSLGSMENTHPNPSLQIIDQSGMISYSPAYLLTDRSKERDGRN